MGSESTKISTYKSEFNQGFKYLSPNCLLQLFVAFVDYFAPVALQTRDFPTRKKASSN
jgi:hypothetical protein